MFITLCLCCSPRKVGSLVGERRALTFAVSVRWPTLAEQNPRWHPRFDLRRAPSCSRSVGEFYTLWSRVKDCALSWHRQSNFTLVLVVLYTCHCESIKIHRTTSKENHENVASKNNHCSSITCKQFFTHFYRLLFISLRSSRSGWRWSHKFISWFYCRIGELRSDSLSWSTDWRSLNRSDCHVVKVPRRK